MVKIAMKEGFTYKSVPFAGDSPTVSALLGGHVMVASGSSVAWKPHVEAKTVRPLLVIEGELEYAPDVPTFEKIGYDFAMSSSIIIFSPKGIPESISEILGRTFLEGMRNETFKKIAIEQGLSVHALLGKDLYDYLKKWFYLYENYIKEAGIYKIERR